MNPPYQDPLLPQPSAEDLAAYTSPVDEVNMSQPSQPSQPQPRAAKGMSFDFSVLNAATQDEYEAKPAALKHLIYEIQTQGILPSQEAAANRVMEIQKMIDERNSPQAKAQQAASERQALGKPLTSTEINDMTALQGVSTSLDTLEKKLAAVSESNRGPFAGRLVGANPYYKEAKEIENVITSIVPGLARGVFGEVGVLTDTDVARYTKLLPNLNSPPDIAKANLANLREKLESSKIEKIETMQKAGMNVSGFLGDYDKLIQDRASRQQAASQSYASPEDVKAAVRSGKLDRAAAVQVLRTQFNLK